MRTGKRRSTEVIISRGLPGIVSLVRSQHDYTAASLYPAAWASASTPLCSPKCRRVRLSSDVVEIKGFCEA